MSKNLLFYESNIKFQVPVQIDFLLILKIPSLLTLRTNWPNAQHPFPSPWNDVLFMAWIISFQVNSLPFISKCLARIYLQITIYLWQLPIL